MKTAVQWCMIVVTRIILNLAISMKLRIDFIIKVATFEPSLLHVVKVYGKSNTLPRQSTGKPQAPVA